MTASLVSFCDDNDTSLHCVNTDEQLATPEDTFPNKSPYISVKKTPTKSACSSSPCIVPEPSSKGGEPTVSQDSKDDHVVPTPVSVSETRAGVGESVLSEAPTGFSAKLQEAFKGLLWNLPLGSFEEMARKEKVVGCYT